MILNAIYVFLIFLEIMLFIYIFVSWFPISIKFREMIKSMVYPIMDPIRFLLKKSIFRTRMIDLAPIIAFVIITYLQQFVLALK